MKHIFFILLVSCLIIACNEPDSKFLQTTNEPSQFFKIAADKDTTFVGEKGTTISFKGNSFQTYNGQEVNGEIQIELKEFYTVSDFINARLSTKTTDGKVLRSSGMIYIQATSDTTNLILRPDHSMKVMFRRVQDSTTANLFSGETTPTGEIQWNLLNSVHNDTLVLTSETTRFKNYGGEEVFLEILFLIGEDTIELTTENRRTFDKILRGMPQQPISKIETPRIKDSSVSYNLFQPEIDPNRLYVFETTSFGYLNCDIFLEEQLHPLTVNVDNFDSDTFIVLNGLNSVLYPDKINKTTNDYIFSIPNNRSISAVSYRKTGGKHYLGMDKTNSTSRKISIKQVEKSLEEIRKEIYKLDGQ